jgi:hypothetical protein
MFSKCGTRVGQHQEVRETLLVPKKHEEKAQKHRCDIPGTPVDIRPAVLLSFCGTAAELSIQSGTRSSAKWVPYSPSPRRLANQLLRQVRCEGSLE